MVGLFLLGKTGLIFDPLPTMFKADPPTDFLFFNPLCASYLA